MNAPIDPDDRNPIKDVYAAAHELAKKVTRRYFVTPPDKTATPTTLSLTDADAADLRGRGYDVEEIR